MATTPNDLLAAALRAAGLSNAETARQVNARARAAGHKGVAVDTARVGRWLKGEQPRPPVPELLAELLRNRTGQPLTLVDIGLTHTGTDPLDPAWSPMAALPSLLQFVGTDLVINRRDLLKVAVGAPLVIAAERLWQHAPSVAKPITGKVGGDEVTGIERLAQMFRELDAVHGGEQFRAAAIAQLSTVITLLKEGQGAAIRDRLYRVGADLAALAGWMSHDAGRYGLAQRYLGYAVTMCRETGDAGRAAEVVSRMSHQQIYLGEYGTAHDLLECAQRTAAKTGQQRLQGMLTAQTGRVVAALGDQQQSLRLLGRAEEHLHAADETGEEAPDWIIYFNHAELAGANAVSCRDLVDLHGKSTGRASSHFARAIEQRPSGYDRVRAMDHVGMAAALLDEDEPERACAVAGDALDLAERLDSRLIGSRVLTLVSSADRYAAHPHVADLRDRVTTWTTHPGLHAA